MVNYSFSFVIHDLTSLGNKIFTTGQVGLNRISSTDEQNHILKRGFFHLQNLCFILEWLAEKEAFNKSQ